MARERRLTFDPQRFSGLDRRYPEFRVFQQGDDRVAYDTLRGECVSDGSSSWSPDAFRAQFAFVERLCAPWPRHLLAD